MRITQHPQTSGHELKPGEVADPVHRYIRFTSIERQIIDHRITQRLRNVSQTGLAQYVYPELRTSRFSHSLGVMHLASRFLAASLRNAIPEVRKELLDALHRKLEQSVGPFGLKERHFRVFDGEPLEISSEIVGAGRNDMRLIEQGLRLAALFHDLGHLPYSHNFEDALEEVARGTGTGEPILPAELFMLDAPAGKLHERLGRRLAELLLDEIVEDVSADREITIRAAFALAQTIFDSTAELDRTPEDAAVRWLHKLIDGELDADRCDYILRDGRNYAFEFAALDLSRLVGNLTVTKKDGAFLVAILPHGLSAAEDFLLARYRSYQHGVRHHKVAQVGAALQHCIATVLRHPGGHAELEGFVEDIKTLARASASDENLAEFKERFADPAARSQFLNRFCTYDDIWWTGVMRHYQRRDNQRRDEWFDLVCLRKAGPETLWKWMGDFPGADDVRRWNARLPQKGDVAGTRNWFAETLRLKQDDVIIVRHTFKPWEPDNTGEDSELCILKKNADLVPVTQLSALIKSLRSAWAEELQVHAFKGSNCNLTADAVFARLTAVMPEA